MWVRMVAGDQVQPLACCIACTVHSLEPGLDRWNQKINNEKLSLFIFYFIFKFPEAVL